MKIGRGISFPLMSNVIISTAECKDGDLRLVAGVSELSGALQVCLSQRWGTVNGDGWTAVDTQVACRQMGFNNAGINTGERCTLFTSALSLIANFVQQWSMCGIIQNPCFETIWNSGHFASQKNKQKNGVR